MGPFPGSWLFAEATNWQVDDRTHAMYSHGVSPTLYQPLRDDKSEIRLLRVASSEKRDAPLSCILETVPLATHPPFQSLSYAWGDHAPMTMLHVGECELKISNNLHDALCTVRKTDQAISLWVDAICINQHDLEERNQQVKLMRQIYTQASAVYVWLGTATPSSPMTFGLLERLARGNTLLSTLVNLDSFGQRQRITELKLLFEYPWWQRLWIIQEALLSQHAVVCCGRYQISFSTIMQAFETIWNEYILDGQQLRDLCGADTIEPLIRKLEMTVRRLHIIQSFVFYFDPTTAQRHYRDSLKSLPFLLHTCAWSQVSDPRDKIYGALGLLSTPFVEPDYNLSAEQVFARSTIEIMNHMGSLSLLSQALQDQQAELRLPTWVPDWTRPSVLTAPYLVFHSLYGAAKGTKVHTQRVKDCTLELTARMVDEVTEVSELYDHRDCSQAAELPAILGPVITAWKAMYERHLLIKRQDRSAPCIRDISLPVANHDEPNSVSHDVLPSTPVPIDVGVQPKNPGRVQSAPYIPPNPAHRIPPEDSIYSYPVQGPRAPIYRDHDHNKTRTGKRKRRADPVVNKQAQPEVGASSRGDGKKSTREVHVERNVVLEDPHPSHSDAAGSGTQPNIAPPREPDNHKSHSANPSNNPLYHDILCPTPPMQSQAASLYRDRDYSSHRSPQPQHRYDMYKQSIQAPLYSDADHATSAMQAHSAVRAPIDGFDFNHTSYTSGPESIKSAISTALIDQEPVAGVTHQRLAKANAAQTTYKVYDNSTHTYVPASEQQSLRSPKHPDTSRENNPDDLILYLAEQGCSFSLQAAVNHLGLSLPEMLQKAQLDMLGLLVEVQQSMSLQPIDRIQHPQTTTARRIRADCARLEQILNHRLSMKRAAQAPNLPFVLLSTQAANTSTKPVNAFDDSDFWRTVTADVIDCPRSGKHRRCSPADEGRVREWLDWIVSALSTNSSQGKNEKPNQLVQLHWHLNTLLQKKRMIITRGGRIGLVGESVKVGDSVCLLGGENYCYILRAVEGEVPESERMKYKLVGPAYVHGLMDGEAAGRDAEDGAGQWDKVWLV